MQMWIGIIVWLISFFISIEVVKVVRRDGVDIIGHRIIKILDSFNYLITFGLSLIITSVISMFLGLI